MLTSGQPDRHLRVATVAPGKFAQDPATESWAGYLGMRAPARNFGSCPVCLPRQRALRGNQVQRHPRKPIQPV
jgi:hypothetical protein